MNKKFILLAMVIFFISFVDISSAGNPIITNFQVVPNTAINDTNPGMISAVVTDTDLREVGFVVIDRYNKVGTNSTILFGYINFSGVSGLYSDWWRGRNWMVTNGVVDTLITRIIISPCSSCPYELASLGRFKKNAFSAEKPVIVWFDTDSERINRITEEISVGIGPSVEIEPGVSIIRFGTFIIPDWSKGPSNSYSNNIYKLYEIGNSKNPYIIWDRAPCGKYNIGVHVIDLQNNEAGLQPIEIDTIPKSGICDTCIDLNGDKTMGIGDVVVLVNNWGARDADPDWNQHRLADLNRDGTIGIGDVVVLVNNWGKLC